MESQFVSNRESVLLTDLDFPFPEGIHAVGRLDKKSEGLLLLTTNKRITSLLFQSHQPHYRKYLVQVKHKVSATRIQQLREGIGISASGGGSYLTAPCRVEEVPAPKDLLPLPYPVFQNIPYCWLQMMLTEGKYHQVRKMTSAIHHKCMRLIRTAIEDLELGDLPPGEVKEIEEVDFFQKLKLHVSI
jgi:23S rRNA pseudouridine2457 synthase